MQHFDLLGREIKEGFTVCYPCGRGSDKHVVVGEVKRFIDKPDGRWQIVVQPKVWTGWRANPPREATVGNVKNLVIV